MLDVEARLNADASGASQAARGRDVPSGNGVVGDARAPVLIVLHQACSTPGHIGRWLTTNGYRLDIRRPAIGDSLPLSLQQHTAAIIFGGPMSANDSDAFLASERRLIEIALKERKACLGVCLGAQLMAQVLGTKVYEDRQGRVEIGYYPISPTKSGAAICAWPEQMYQWHREGFDLPAEAQLLAQSDGIFPDQAYVYGGNAVGIQFHPEITLAMIYRWTTRGADRLEFVGARPQRDHIAGHMAWQRQVDAWRNDFLGNWITSETDAAPPRVERSKDFNRSISSLPIS